MATERMHVFLDLDGTLIDPKPGITGAVAYALRELGMNVPEPDDLAWVIGPALIDSFKKLGVADPEQALALYRARYTDTGLFEAQVYDGIPEALAKLRDTGCELILMTAKPHAYAGRITQRFGLSKYLAREFGPELDGTRNDKCELLAHALSLTGIEASHSVMVGDRIYDIEAAQSVGMRSVGVTWGYGSAEETAQADRQCDDPSDLPEAIIETLKSRYSND